MNAQHADGRQQQEEWPPTIRMPAGSVVGPNPLFADRRPDTELRPASDLRPGVGSGSGVEHSGSQIVVQPGSQVIVLSPSEITTRAEQPAVRRRPGPVARLGGPLFLIGLLVTGLAAGGGMAVAVLDPQALGDRRDTAISLSGVPAAVPSPAAEPAPVTTALDAGAPARPGRCTATASLEEWPGGFVARVAVHAQESIESWTVTLELPAGVTITQTWNGERTGDTGVVRVADAGYNGTVAAGAETEFGYQATGSAAGTDLECAAEAAVPQLVSPTE